MVKHTYLGSMAVWILFIVVFWNVENYFDIFPNKNGSDRDFTPGGTYVWTRERFYRKRNALIKTIIAMGTRDSAGRWEYPAVIGLAEVENRYVLEQLLDDTPLTSLDYGIIHKDSPDGRGIDVALLYRKERFEPSVKRFLPLRKPDSTVADTREILYVKGVLDGKDTLHFFVNHWPSRRGGAMAESMRKNAAFLTGIIVDSLCRDNPAARIIVMGDFNDPPDSRAITLLCRHNLVNVSEGYTYKYRGRWTCFDQFLVSSSMIPRIHVIGPANFPFLMEKDEAHLGMKPKRTYSGPRYLGGISDHLPVSLKIITFVSYGRANSQNTSDGPVFCH